MKRNETTRERAQSAGEQRQRPHRGHERNKRAWTRPHIETSEAFEDVALTTCNQTPGTCLQALA